MLCGTHMPLARAKAPIMELNSGIYAGALRGELMLRNRLWG